jgi:hypothetical protein
LKKTHTQKNTHIKKQEPTIQTCVKIVQSTCLAQGIEVKTKGKRSTEEFQCFVDRYYLSFAEEAVRHFFTLGFVPWRLRKLASGDAVPEVVPLGLFSWSIESMPNSHATMWKSGTQKQLGMDPSQAAAQIAFERQKAFFSSNDNQRRYRPYNEGKNSSAYRRQQRAMKRLAHAVGNGQERDDNDTKMLR